MKIGLVTFNRKNNYEDLLATYALKTYLEKLNLEVEIINYRNQAEQNEQRVGIMGRIARKLKTILKLQKQDKMLTFKDGILTMTKLYPKFSTLQKDDAVNHDILIAGPNKIWNIGITNGFDTCYFLEFGKKGARRISYSPSLGQDNLPVGFSEMYDRYIKNFDFISVRDKNMINLFSKMTSRNIVQTINPILLLEKNDFDKIKEDSHYKDSKYLYVHFAEVDTSLVEIVNKVSELLKLRVIHNKEKGTIENELAICNETPEQFISLIENAEFVLSNSEEILSLALLFKKKFLALSGYGITDFLCNLKLDNKLIKDIDSIKLENGETRLSSIQRQASVDFLNDSIFGELTDKKHDNYLKTNIKYNCYGCTMCKDICPRNAIEMVEDDEGFVYPAINDNCNKCGLCERRCIYKNSKWNETNNEYPKVFAAINNNQDDLMASASGGMFSVLYRYVIAQKGYVVGVGYNDRLEPEYGIASTIEECEKFRGSKYVAPKVGDIKPRIKKLLDDGKIVLFTGNPCQVAAIKNYLNKDYDNLYLVDILCHSVSSPKVFRKYISYLNEKYDSEVIDFKFRSKENGWGGAKEKCKVTFKSELVITEVKPNNNFYKAFHSNLLSRPSCCNCEFAGNDTISDITMGDYWGIDKIMPEVSSKHKKGISVIKVGSKKGSMLLNKVLNKLELHESNLKDAYKSNHKCPTKLKKERHEFMKQIDTENINELLEKHNPIKNQKTSDKEIIRNGL